MLLKRVIDLACWRFRPPEEVITHHRSHTRNITAHEEYLPVVAAENLVAQVHQTSGDVDPHECQVPLQRSSQPASQCKGFGPVDQVVLGNLCPEARERPEYLEPAANQHEERHCIQPMTAAHDEGMLVYGRCRRASLLVVDRQCASRHDQLSCCLETIKFRVALILPVADLLEDMRHLQISQILCLLIPNLGWNLQA